MNNYQDSLSELNKNITLSEKLRFLHEIIRKRYEFVHRIAVAVYDPKTDLLKTFLHSSGTDDPLSRYEARLGESGALQEIRRTGRPRVVRDFTALESGRKEHTLRIAAQGYRSSYTLPLFMNGVFFGFIFFDSYGTDSFRPEALPDLDLLGHLVSVTVANDLSNIRTMMASVKAARDFTAFRDMELGAHLDRIAHYSRLIARELAPSHRLDDEFIEHIFLFAPLHDIGKIGIPDAILQKADALDAEEFEAMKAHTRKGREIIDGMLQNFGLESIQHIEILRNIAEYHHEAVNGTGYPRGLKGEDIPLEARIVSAADIFDALTNLRSYKPAWTNAQAFLRLRELAGSKLDGDCVEALIHNAEGVEKIQKRFRDEAAASEGREEAVAAERPGGDCGKKMA